MTPTALESLLETLQNGHNLVRPVAASRLGKLRDARAVEPLIGALGDPNRRVQLEAVQALVNIGAPAVGSLVQALREEKADVWMLASAALVQIGETAVASLLSALDNETEPVQILIVEILGRVQAGQAVDTLVERLRSDDRNLRAASAIALVRIGEPSVVAVIQALFDHGDQVLHRYGSEILKRIGESAVHPLLQSLYSGSDNERTQAAYILGQIGEPAVPGLMVALVSNNDQTRYAAAWALGYTSSETAVSSLIDCLTDTVRSARTGMRICDVAAVALERIGSAVALIAVECWRLNEATPETGSFEDLLS